jgi:hypothetical protein
MIKISTSQLKALAVIFMLTSVIFLSVQTTSAVEPALPDPDAWYPNAVITTETASMYVTYGTSSYFDIEISGISDIYSDVQDGTYEGWCFEKSVPMTKEMWHNVKLCHSYDPNKPAIFDNANWDMINYIINHKAGWDKETIQDTIWYFIEGTTTTSPTALSLIEEAEQQGSGYCPSAGDLLAVLVYLDPAEEPYEYSVQNTFIEVPLNYEGCPPCFWQYHINDIYADTGIDPDECLCDYFDLPPPFETLTIRQILLGPTTICGCLYPKYYCEFGLNLLIEATAALLNIYHPDISYPISEPQLQTSVNDAMKSGFCMLRLWVLLDVYNTLGDDVCICCTC